MWASCSLFSCCNIKVSPRTGAKAETVPEPSAGQNEPKQKEDTTSIMQHGEENMSAPPVQVQQIKTG